MAITKCVVFFENEYNGNTVVEDVKIVKEDHTILTYPKYCRAVTDGSLKLREIRPCYHDNTDADPVVFETIPVTSVQPVLLQACATSLPLNSSHPEHNTKRTWHSATGLDYLCYCDMSLCNKTVNKLPMDVSLAGCVSSTMCQSSKFCRGFLKYAKYHSMKTSLIGRTTDDGAAITVPFLVKVCLVHKFPEWIDFKWCDRMQCLITKRMMLGDALNWLSTLGGAYSALGDYYQHHAVQAGEISMRQLKLALEVGDKPSVIRCHLYFGLSLMQRGHLRLSRNVIRYQYKRATSLPVIDRQLLSVCRGLWTKLRYLYEKRKEQKATRHHPHITEGRES